MACFDGASGVKASLPRLVSRPVGKSPNPSLPLIFFWLQNERMREGEALGHCKYISTPGKKTIVNAHPTDVAW